MHFLSNAKEMKGEYTPFSEKMNKMFWLSLNDNLFLLENTEIYTMLGLEFNNIS